MYTVFSNELFIVVIFLNKTFSSYIDEYISFNKRSDLKNHSIIYHAQTYSKGGTNSKDINFELSALRTFIPIHLF